VFLQSITTTQKLILALTVVVVLVAFWAGRPRSASESHPSTVGFQPGGEPLAAPIVVYVSGAVQRPGLYQLPAGSRVSRAISAAGGLTPEADADSVNLAAFCEDGQQIDVSAREQARTEGAQVVQQPAPAPRPPLRDVALYHPPTAPMGQPSSRAPYATHNAATADAAVPRPDTTTFPHAAGTAMRAQKVPLNSADLEQLQQLPGVGETLAKRIITWRQINGPFRSFDELDDIPGIGPATIDEIRLHATLR